MRRFATLLAILLTTQTASADLRASSDGAGATSADGSDGTDGDPLPASTPVQPATSVASLQPDRQREAERRDLAKRLQVPIILVENVLLLGPPTWYYWRTVEDQMEDWEMNWSWEDWRAKLTTTDPLVLDTNRFEANGIRHPIAGALAYQIGRANGLGVLGSTLLDLANAFVWEYVAEYRERPSFNDLFTNTAAGFLVGEPLFQLASLSDGHPSLLRRGLAMIAAPPHRLQKEGRLSPLLDAPRAPHRLEAIAGTNAVRYGDDDRARGELRLGLDLEVLRDRDFGRAGEDVTYSGLAHWNRVALDLRFGGVADGGGFAGGRFRSSTTYVGRTEKSIDIDGTGRTTFVGVGTGFEVMQRKLPTITDQFSVFRMVEPRFGGWWHTPHADIDVEAGVSGDVAMVKSLARADMPLLMDSSILLTRGYYYATGVSANARVRARRGRWSAELESTAHQFWSFDEHSHGGDNDPKDLADSRMLNSATIGVKPTSADVRVELFGNAVLRRGTGTDLWRQAKELDAGVALKAAF